MSGPKWRIFIVGTPPGSINGPMLVLQWLARFTDTRDGRGLVDYTIDRKKAIAFENAEDARQFYMQVSKRVPRRPDGMPNRPLTCMTGEIVRDDCEPLSQMIAGDVEKYR